METEMIKSKILEALYRAPIGLTIEQLSDFTTAHRQTVAKYVLVLEAQGMLRRRRVGVAMLHYPADVASASGLVPNGF
jgi:DNA-binding IclR family transcriptional regulator